MSLLTLIASVVPSLTQNNKSVVPSFGQHNTKILAIFEEWSIYYAGYNIANLQQNGVAGKLTHLMYAFANVADACSRLLHCGFLGPKLKSSTSGQRYLFRPLWKLCGDSTTQAAPSQPQGFDVDWWGIGGEHCGFCNRCEHGGQASGTGCLVYRSFL